MTADLTVFVPGRPAPQGSKRLLGRGVMVESSKAVAPWRADVRDAVHGHERFDGPVFVHLEFVLPRPKSHYRTGRNAHLLRETAPPCPAGKPDLDKLVRAVLDAVGSAGAWRDDSQVVRLQTTKRYTTGDEDSGVRILIRPEED